MDSPQIDPSLLETRMMGGYLVSPGSLLLRSVRRPTERLKIAAAALRALRAAEQRVMAVMDDAAIELRDRHNVSWYAIGQRAQVDPRWIKGRVETRRRLLDRGRGDQHAA